MHKKPKKGQKKLTKAMELTPEELRKFARRKPLKYGVLLNLQRALEGDNIWTLKELNEIISANKTKS